jgi:D-alanine transfer protein
VTHSHLPAALGACLLLAALISGGTLYAQHEEVRYVRALAAVPMGQKDAGRALEVAAVQQPDILPLYASSDLRSGSKEQAARLFANAPTGFEVMAIGRPGASPLSYLQRLAALGPLARGRKLAFTLTTPAFVQELADQDAQFYGHSFSPLPASELAFSTDLSLGLRQAVARRMVQYPDTLAAHPLLAFALARLADGSPAATAEYALTLPLGKLQVLILRLQDHWATLTYLRTIADALAPGPPAPALPNWEQVQASAKRYDSVHAYNNAFGFEHQYWNLLHRDLLRAPAENPAVATRNFEQQLATAPAWQDYELMLRVAAELGAQPLVLSPPLKGRFYDTIGVSPQARGELYARIESLAAQYGAQVDDFRSHDEDLLFVENRGSHPGAVGWTYYDRDLDAFFHGHTVSDPHRAPTVASGSAARG